jgi:hypothetical protein
MRFWDTSALVALLVEQKASTTLRGLHRGDPVLVVWILTDVEAGSALARLVRENTLSAEQAQVVGAKLHELWQACAIIPLADEVKIRARRLLLLHPLSAADALQLAAALLAVKDQPHGSEFACLDQRLAEAARREGFHVVP